MEEAFEFGLDPANWTRHIPDLADYEIVEEAPDEMHIRLSYRVLRIPMEFDIKMHVVEPNRHIAVRFESKWMAGVANYHYSEIEEGTLLESRGTYDFGDSFIARVLAPVLRVSLHRKIRNAARKEKRLIEAAAAGE